MVFWIILAILCLIIFFLRFWLFHISYFFFSYLENLFKFSENVNPVVSWLIIGVLFGAIIGGIVASEKYKLEKQYYLTPVSVLIMLMISLTIINKPLAAYQKDIDATVKDSINTIVTDSITPKIANKTVHHTTSVRRKRKHSVKSDISTVKDTLETKSSNRNDSIIKNRDKFRNGIIYNKD